ncbi:hypothetical protein [Silvanigrella aquatica]|uniref:Uncharacterized protein n=1 Tax=Silvanigrella aquatica TaxID=1915309 RepID=A0A1L4D2G2_9BACT|nr:hypothetical protein [Silvanigrella aquatica]APJ04377.1 hypothetical protein AXG55_10855 [Silvanigrella aquatica]
MTHSNYEQIKNGITSYLSEVIRYLYIPFIDIYGYNDEFFKTANNWKEGFIFFLNNIIYIISNTEKINESNKNDYIQKIKEISKNNAYAYSFRFTQVMTIFQHFLKEIAPQKSPSPNLKSFLNTISPSTSESKQERTKFLELFRLRLVEIKIKTQLYKTKITLEEILGSRELLTQYKKAIAEENKSKHFHKAVILNGSFHCDKIKWDHKAHIIVAGPSGVGKSFNSKRIIDYLANQNFSLSSNIPANGSFIQDFIFIDGGIPRNVSQIRNVVLQCALVLGYSGISDLHAMTKFDVKSKIKKVAMNHNVHIIEPLTFVRHYYTPSLESGYKFFKEEFIYKPYHLIFVNIEGDKLQTLSNQEKRAWFIDSEAKPKEYVSPLNTDIGCESKKGEGNYDEGIKASNHFAEIYHKKYISKNKEKYPSIYIEFMSIQNSKTAELILNKSCNLIKINCAELNNIKLPGIPKIFMSGIWVNKHKDKLIEQIKLEINKNKQIQNEPLNVFMKNNFKKITSEYSHSIKRKQNKSKFL